MDEEHVLVDSERVSGELFDSALAFFYNSREKIALGAGPFDYLSKLENHREARLWNDIFLLAPEELGLPRGTIKATVLLETIFATFEMDEILHDRRGRCLVLSGGSGSRRLVQVRTGSCLPPYAQ